MLGDEYKDYCNRFSAVWNYLESNSKDINQIVDEVCKFRLYFGEEDKWLNLFKDIGVAYVSSETCNLDKLNTDSLKDLGLFSEEGNFLLNERYIVPVKDMLGNIIALIGWYPDTKKYITTPSRFFTKDCLFFGLEQVQSTGLGANYFLLEGVFDALHLRALGFNAIANMGINSSKEKEVLYGLFKKIVGIPDNDSSGRRVIKYDTWKLPVNASYLRWKGNFKSNIYSGEDDIYVKDIDRLCSLYEEEDVKELLSNALLSNSRVYEVSL